MSSFKIFYFLFGQANDISENIQMEMIDCQCDSSLKDKFDNSLLTLLVQKVEQFGSCLLFAEFS